MFLFWTLVGFSLVSLLGNRQNLVRNALLAPATGAGVTALLISWVNVAGIPVKHAGLPVAAALVLASGLILWRLRPVFPYRRLKPFLIVVLVAALVVGYPMLLFGFNWLAYCNDDMANYALIANLYLHHGYLDLPDSRMFLQNRDASLVYWYLEPYGGIRSGPDELLAWTAAATGLNTQEAFMPTILALHLALISAAGALVLRRRDFGLASVVVCACLAVSALNTLGTVSQLIAQVFGIALLIALSTVLLRPFSKLGRLRAALLASILGAALGMVYPEVTPFFILSFLAYHAILLFQRRESAREFLVGTALLIPGTAIFLGYFLAVTIRTVLLQSAGGMMAAFNAAFPYFLMPSGLANLWGFAPVEKYNQPLLGAWIIVGAVLLFFVVVKAIGRIRRDEPADILLLVMAAVGAYLFYKKAGFGLFKLAMFIQPFLISSLVLAWFETARRRVGLTGPASAFRSAILMAPLALIAGMGIHSQIHYLLRSTGYGYQELPRASSSGLVSRLDELSREREPSVLVSDSSNQVLAKFEALHFIPSRMVFPAADYFGTMAGGQTPPIFKTYLDFFTPGLSTRAEELRDQWNKQVKTYSFQLHDAFSGVNRFQVREGQSEIERGAFGVLESGPAQQVMNRRTESENEAAPPVRLVQSQDVRNHLILVHSELGKLPLPQVLPAERTAGKVGVYGLEADYFFPNDTMAAIGRHSLFHILKPAKQVRLVVEYTASLNGDGDNRIPPASVIGETRNMFGVEGRGSARIVSEPLEPQTVAGGAYIGLDMGVPGKPFPDMRSGIMMLYGADLPMDPRRIVGFVRDISLISASDYAALKPPEELDRFPECLGDKNLEYSGIYEDGWVGESSFVVLSQPEGAALLIVRAAILRGGASQLRVNVDGVEASRRSLSTGDLELTIPVSPVGGKRRIELVFDGSTHLAKPDNRPASARVQLIGFRRTRGTLAH